MSGPTFSWIYVGLLVLPVVVRPLWMMALRRGAGGADQLGALPSVYHLAYLAGGPDRVIDTAIAVLVEREQLRVATGGRVYPVGSTPAQPLEQAVISRIPKTSGMTIGTVRSLLREDEAVKRIVAELEERALIVPERKRRLVGPTIIGLYGFAVLLGIARWSNGVNQGFPVGYLSALILVAIAAVVGAWYLNKKQTPVSPTAAGRELLERARSAEAERPAEAGPGEDGGRAEENQRALAVATGGGLLVGAAGAVALGGLTSYPDEELSEAMAPPPAITTSSWGGGSSYGGGSSCGGSSSSCGGGASCGGGGGGGCGGGGGG
ncbi:TIGR04222 domain-containing membrane protein [Amycolatopsis nigrescens]|uniref:TIGR04222 domain-containing membrane protein n=1 Tax=Amycolatopsis nigrescens TaxID=381445 RepID=UPI00037E4344|nr:TIGR04222 domain-containing membrane protein [Amycolatopsis nigrescens]